MKKLSKGTWKLFLNRGSYRTRGLIPPNWTMFLCFPTLIHSKPSFIQDGAYRIQVPKVARLLSQTFILGRSKLTDLPNTLVVDLWDFLKCIPSKGDFDALAIWMKKSFRVALLPYKKWLPANYQSELYRKHLVETATFFLGDVLTVSHWVEDYTGGQRVCVWVVSECILKSEGT